MDIEIQSLHVEVAPEWRTLIDDRLAMLAARYPELIRVHVTLKHGAHHQRGLEEVDVVATCTGGTLRAGKQEETMRAAVHAALDALEREVAAQHEQRRRFGKAPGPRPSGTIAQIFTDRGYGFIRTDDGEEVYFHRHALQELEFESLTIGQPVELDLERGARGLQASRVFPAGERMAT
jgi:ribosomal subunit interface protein